MRVLIWETRTAVPYYAVPQGTGARFVIGLHLYLNRSLLVGAVVYVPSATPRFECVSLHTNVSAAATTISTFPYLPKWVTF